MIWKIIKKILTVAELQVRLHSGDQLVIVVKWHNQEVFRRTIDFIPGA